MVIIYKGNQSVILGVNKLTGRPNIFLGMIIEINVKPGAPRYKKSKLLYLFNTTDFSRWGMGFVW